MWVSSLLAVVDRWAIAVVDGLMGVVLQWVKFSSALCRGGISLSLAVPLLWCPNYSDAAAELFGCC
jgi:hypothetical protein